VAVVTATSGITSEVEKTTSGVLALTTHSEGVNEVNLVVGATTKLVAFVAVVAVEGGIECVHRHILTLTTDTLFWEFGKTDLNYVKTLL
jgi:hypothetical protein